MTSQMSRYSAWLGSTRGLYFQGFQDLWRWSVGDLEGFWQSIWDYHQVQSPTPHRAVLAHSEMPGAIWFPGAQVNYAAEVFRHTEVADQLGVPAIIAENEAGEVETLGWCELRRRGASLALELAGLGVEAGDRVAAYLPNGPEAVIALLACASIGAIWSVCAPDMGTPAVLDRFRQIEPKVLIAADGVLYAGKRQDLSSTIGHIRAGLPTLRALIMVRTPFAEEHIDADLDFVAACARDDALVSAFAPRPLPFDHPLWILYSSGTTGLPKAIVHGHGGVILGALAGAKHYDLGPSYDACATPDRFHWYSSTGWVMWNAQVNALLTGTTICLFNGSPSGSKQRPDWSVLWRFAARHGVTWFGAGAAFYASCRKAEFDLHAQAAVQHIRALGSTGSPLPAEVQAWGTAQFAKAGQAVWWCNITGGTDICGNFAAGNCELPATPGRLQCRQLGASVEAWDETGQAVTGQVGELVCTKPIPSMPLFFWGDGDGQRYRESYFDMWPGVWRHGDWLRIDEDGSCTIAGRSDATINRHGHRMGTAELYSAIEALEVVQGSMVVDLEDGAGSSQLLLFVVLADEQRLDEVVTNAICGAVRAALSPRFVPDFVVAAPAIPRTLSGKKQEVPIKRLFQGHEQAKVINPDLIANPESLPWYSRRAEAWMRGVRPTAAEWPA